MELTTNFIALKYDEYNALYFNNELSLLKRPTFGITNSKRVLGEFICRRNFLSSRYFINISNYYLRSEEGFCNTILHEMIHLYINQKGLYDNSTHGRTFKTIAMRLSDKSGMLITVKSTLPKGIEINPLYGDKIRKAKKINPYNICVLNLTDGRIFIASVAKNSIEHFDKCLKESKYNVTKWEWFTSSSVMYSKMKVCRSRLAGKYISVDEYNRDYLLSKEVAMAY